MRLAGGPQRMLAVDRRAVESAIGTKTRMFPPAKQQAALVQERPWEAYYMHAGQVIECDGLYRLYYIVYITDDGPRRTETCVALSNDGIRWERPELGLVPYKGSVRNNMIPGHGFVSIDPLAPPERRWLMCGWDARLKQGEPGFVQDGLALYTSDDGYRWAQATPALTPFTCDTMNQVFYDEDKGTYVAYLRAYGEAGRAVAYYETDRPFEPWPVAPAEGNEGEMYATLLGPVRTVYVRNELPIVMQGNRQFQLYHPSVNKYGNMYFAFPDVFRLFPGPSSPLKERFADSELYAWRNDGLLSPRMYMSEDGISFRPASEKAYISLGRGDAFDTKQVRMAVGMIESGDELWQYYTGHRTSHTLARGERPREGCAIVRTVQRKDGFAALSAGLQGGVVKTWPVTVTGSSLSVNFDAGALGDVRAELSDPEGRVLPGFGLGDCDPLIGNAVHGTVRWADNRTLRDFIGRTVRITFHLRQADLFAFGFAGGKEKRG